MGPPFGARYQQVRRYQQKYQHLAPLDEVCRTAMKFTQGRRSCRKPKEIQLLATWKRGRSGERECREKREWCPEADSNHRHADFQSAALPTELSGPVPANGIRLPDFAGAPDGTPRKRVGYSTGILAVQSNSRKSAQRFSGPQLRENKSNSRKSAQLFSCPQLRENKRLAQP